MVGHSRRDVGRVVFLLSLLVVAPASGAVVGEVQAAASDGETIHRTLELSLTPETPGEIAATATFELPSNVRSLETTLPADATVTNTRGFSKASGQTYRWDESTANPRIRFTVPANETGAGVRASEIHRTGTGQSGSYSFVDTGSWALVTVPQLGTRWQYVGDRVTLEKSTTVAGEGSTGGQMAYLGPHRTVTRTANGQEFEFVIPEAASLRESPGDILDSTSAAAATLRVGNRDEHVFMVAAPTTIAWSAAGIEYGGSDYWVQADERLDEPRNVWLHEYVHTRQEYEPTAETQWTIEAGAEYNAALLTLRQERIGFTSFRRHLERGTREPVASAVLADPSTWSSGTQYLKGALVFGNVDRQIRLDSNGSNSMQAVLSRMNSDPDQVTASEFYSAVASAGDSSTRRYAERYAGTSDVPDAWSVTDHQQAFSTLPARVGYQTTEIRVSGPVRNTTLTPTTVVTTRETVLATVEVTNTGGANGTYETAMYLDGVPVANATGTIAPEETETVTLRHTVDTTGTYSLRVGDTTRTLVVEEPAEPQVAELAVNATQQGDTWTATIDVTLTNPASRPASGSVPVTIDGTTVATIEADLASGASITRTVTTEISPGSHTVAAGDASTTIDVPTPTSPTETTAPAPGPGPLLVGIVLLATILARRRLQH